MVDKPGIIIGLERRHRSTEVPIEFGLDTLAARSSSRPSRDIVTCPSVSAL